MSEEDTDTEHGRTDYEYEVYCDGGRGWTLVEATDEMWRARLEYKDLEGLPLAGNVWVERRGAVILGEKPIQAPFSEVVR